MWQFWLSILIAGLVFGFAAARARSRRLMWLLLLGPLLVPPVGWTVTMAFLPGWSPDDWI